MAEEDLLKKLEDEFINKYTEEDDQYDLALTEEDLKPPVLTDWAPEYRSEGGQWKNKRKSYYGRRSPYECGQRGDQSHYERRRTDVEDGRRGEQSHYERRRNDFEDGDRREYRGYHEGRQDHRRNRY